MLSFNLTLNSPGVLVVVVAVVEEAGAVETERVGWEVGATAEDEEEREGVADSAAAGEKKEKSIIYDCYKYKLNETHSPIILVYYSQ